MGLGATRARTKSVGGVGTRGNSSVIGVRMRGLGRSARRGSVVGVGC